MPIRRLYGITGPIHFRTRSENDAPSGYAQWVRGPLTRLAARNGIATPLPDPADQAEISILTPARTVFLHNDRWAVQCPDCGRDYQFLWPVECLFLCSVCWNVEALGLYRRVQLPLRWELVDRAAGKAPYAHQRNWIPLGSKLQHRYGEVEQQSVKAIVEEFGSHG